MKHIIYCLALSLPFVAEASCNKKIDDSKVMLFVDTNNSELEIKTSEKAACERGEKLVIVPKNYQEYSKYTSALNESQKKFDRCSKTGKDCSSLEQELYATVNKLDKFKMDQPSIEEGIKEALSQIKEKKGKLKNFTISGHDGGGSFGGNKGGFDRFQLAEMIGEYQDINEVSSVLLLGCYTGVQNEIYAWKKIFPKARLIAGYDGSAPLADRPQGHEYLSDILLKEKDLLKNADEKKLLSYTKANIKSLNQLHAAMYLDCDENNEFYYGADGGSKKFRPFDMKECEKKKPEMEAIVKAMAKYESGEMDPPSNTATGEIRQLYIQARRLEHCNAIIGPENGVNTNNVFNLLFYEGVKESFASYYKDDLQKAESIISELDLAAIEKGMEDYQKKQDEIIKTLSDKVQLMEKDPEGYLAQEKEKLDKIAAEKDKLLNDPQYASVASLFTAEGMFNYNSQPTPEDMAKLRELMPMMMGYSFSKQTYELEKNHFQEALSEKKRLLEVTKTYHEAYTAPLIEIKKRIANKEKLVWSPTFENLNRKSRKETLDNIHQMNALMTLPGLPEKQRKAMQWLSQVSTNHLVHFQNPFSWHEFTGKAEQPMFSIGLNQVMEGTFMPYSPGYSTPLPGMIGGGYGGGFGTIGGFGGTVGGMGNGY